jgi:hypothetical protein
MKPCVQYRKLIAMLALDELENKHRQTRELRTHLDACEGCRRYYAEISNVTAKLTAPEPDTAIRASAAFHRRLVGALKTEEPVRTGNLLAWFQAGFENWRTALALTGAVVVLMMVSAILVSRPRIPTPALVVAGGAPAPAFSDELPPTIANYQMVANRSLDKLDELLTRQSRRNPPPAPIYTVSDFTRADLTD